MTECEPAARMVARRHAVGYIVCIGRDPEPPHHRLTAVTAVILVQSSESSDWAVLPGTYATFQDARDMVGFIHSSYGPTASFGIESVDNVDRKGWLRA